MTLKAIISSYSQDRKQGKLDMAQYIALKGAKPIIKELDKLNRQDYIQAIKIMRDLQGRIR